MTNLFSKARMHGRFQRPEPRLLRPVTLSVLVVLLASCGEVAPLGADNTIQLHEEVLDRDGGRLSIAGAVVSVPIEALEEPVGVSLERLDFDGALMPHAEAAGPAVALGPHWLVLNKVAQIELDYDGPDEGLVIAARLGECDAWRTIDQVTPTFFRGTASFNTPFFGDYVVARQSKDDVCLTSEECSCFDDECFEDCRGRCDACRQIDECEEQCFELGGPCDCLEDDSLFQMCDECVATECVPNDEEICDGRNGQCTSYLDLCEPSPHRPDEPAACCPYIP